MPRVLNCLKAKAASPQATQTVSTSDALYPSPNLGRRLATSHTDGRAAWWKSPRADLARAPREKSLGATLQRRFRVAALHASVSDNLDYVN